MTHTSFLNAIIWYQNAALNWLLPSASADDVNTRDDSLR
jgi:hypothetical protein